ncbi:MAG: methyltransferase domain-containing protein [Ferruginibacter sp.]
MLSVAPPAISRNDKWFDSDERFHLLYPAPMQTLAFSHWTPLDVARRAAWFLAAEQNVQILDIGSGIGKFCLSAAYFMPKAFYTGIEQRKKLVDHAENAKNNLGLQNIEFIHGNFTKLDFANYDHFYFYNSFYENFSFTDKIDDSVGHSKELYHYYARHLLKQLEQKPAGTRLATFHSLEDEIPADFLVVGSEMENQLKFWIKI